MSNASTNIDNVGDEPAEVFELSEEEWRAAANRGLRRIGLTFDELARQAAEDNFESIEAMKLWWVLDGERP